MHTIDAFIRQQSGVQQPALHRLHFFILQQAPRLQESIKWDIPFYAYHGLLCYINPKADRLLLGFCKGAFLSNEEGLLLGKGKEVRRVELFLGDQWPEDSLRQIIQEALLYNEALARRKALYV